MYEWLPWVGGRLDEVPESKEERFTYLMNYILTVVAYPIYRE